MIEINDLSLDARRQLAEVQQRYAALRAVEAELSRRFSGSMAWRPRAGKNYLYRRRGRVERSLGPRDAATETVFHAFTAGKAAAETHAAGLRGAIEAMAPVSRAMGLGRVPLLAAKLLRRLDQAGVLGRQLCVVGTHALFAYEAEAGLHFAPGLLATEDVDLALDARRNLALAGRALPEGVMATLQRLDPSFRRLPEAFRAVNGAGLMVDLIVAEPRDRMRSVHPRLRRIADAEGDLHAVEVPGLELIVDAPRVEAVAVDETGLPVWIAAADPRWWAAHKLWLAERPDRQGLKRARDRAQAEAVAAVIARQGSDLSDGRLSTVPAPLRDALRALVAATPSSSPAW